MRSYFIASLLLHVGLVVIGSIAAELMYTPPPVLRSLDVALVSPVDAAIEDVPPAPPEEIERPEAPVEADPIPEVADDPLPEPEMPDSELPPPPPPEEIERPELTLDPDPLPEEDFEEIAEAPDLAPPDTDLPPPPVIDDLPEPDRVQRAAAEDTTVRQDEPAAPTPAVAATPPEQVKEALGSGREVGVQSDSGVDDGYLTRVQRKIGRRWQPTPASALGKPRVLTIVSFRVRPDGTIENPRVSEPSGLSVFDRQALRAVMDASPLPKLPPRFGDSISINFRFEYTR